MQEAESLESSSQTFLIDKWATAPSRSGITAVMQDGCLLEKVRDCNFALLARHQDHTFQLPLQGAVNISVVQGKLTPERAMAMSSRGRGIHHAGGQSYSAAALSLVFHPANPFVPTLRADVRLFQVCYFLQTNFCRMRWCVAGQFVLTCYQATKPTHFLHAT